MTTVYRGTVDRSGDGYPGSIQLTKDIIKDIDFKNVIYGERSQSGAMGNAGGIILYVLKNKEMTRYETNVNDDEETAIEALRQITLNEDLFDLYYGGMGNGVFIRKKVSLGLDDTENCFWYEDGKSKYKIKPSVKGVYIMTSQRIKGEKPKGLDSLHQEWEQGLREKFLKTNPRINIFIDDALQIGKEEGFIKVGRLQRRLRIGYQDAKQLVDTMEEKGLIESYDETRWKIVKDEENSKHE
jgi:predicted transcriptional regulator